MASALAPPAQAAAAKQQEVMANLLSQPHTLAPLVPVAFLTAF